MLLLSTAVVSCEALSFSKFLVKGDSGFYIVGVNQPFTFNVDTIHLKTTRFMHFLLHYLYASQATIFPQSANQVGSVLVN